MKNIFAILAIALVFLMTGYAISCVGTLPECDGLPYESSLPWTVFMLMAIPTILGYLAGLIDGQQVK